ncbi:DUF397 domain-containing protein [Streptomyces jumonjinensis]|uniref:DUF397 domain-containing protein n=1 Tax=Streptomyces jumonjinensis TaxID=1945 RepID=UPI00378F41B8
MNDGRAMANALGGAVWKKSSYSGGSEGQCVEVADVRAHGGIAVRDSKNPTGPILLMTPEVFIRFLDTTAQNEFGRH